MAVSLRALWDGLPFAARLLTTATTALVVASAVMLLTVAREDARRAREDLAATLAAELDTLPAALAETVVIGDFSTLQQTLDRYATRPLIVAVNYRDTSGVVLKTSVPEPPEHAPQWFSDLFGYSPVSGQAKVIVGGRTYGEVELFLSPRQPTLRAWRSLQQHLGILLVAVTVDFIGIWLILRFGLRPLERLKSGAARLAAGDLSVRLEARGSPELRETIEAFNRMASHLEAARNALQEESERLATILASIGDGVIATDADGCVTFMNPVAEALTGWPAAEAQGRSILQVFPIVNEHTRQGVECPVGRAIREGVIVDLANHTLLLARDGSERPIADSAAPIRDLEGCVLGAVLVFRDQTEERRTLERLRLAASVFEHALNGVMITDAQRRIVSVNPAFCRITGYRAEEVIGRRPRILSSGKHEASFYDAMWQQIRETGHWQGEIWNRRKDGEIYPEELTIIAVTDEQGEATNYLGIFRDLSEIKRKEAQLIHLAHHDPLTGLPNRSLLNDRFAVALSQAQRSTKKLAVCYLDLDGFKPINDHFGHPIGDRLLIEIAKRLSAAIRGGDTVARLGGDEFLLLLTSLANVEECESVLERILAAVAEPMEIDGQAHSVTASIGVTLYPDDAADADTLMRHADQALYIAKEAGRNRYQLFDPKKDAIARSRRAFFEEVEAALAQDQFVLFYQPKVNMREGRMIGVEALIRWQHPQRGLLSPGEFLPQLEGSELEIRLDEWVIDKALAQIGRWRRQDLEIPIAVNIAPAHLARPDFSSRLKAQLDRHPDTPSRLLEIEVLESAALADLEHTAEVLAACRSFGVRVALDDFGTGYASLAYLKHLPVDLIKIDQGFVRGALSSASDLAIVEAVIGLAEAFHLEVLAEGVETIAHGEALIHLGCLLGQGYGIARPLPAEALADWLARWQANPAWTSLPAHWARDEAVLLGAEIDHRLWIDQLQKWLAQETPQEQPPELDRSKCRFGRWYYGPGQLHYGAVAEFRAIDEFHERVHRLAQDIVAQKLAGQPTEVQTAELLALRDQLIEQLHALAKAIGVA